ncbi:B-cell receptor-associated 31-like protein [Epithele typhae]|uniref:B-cell receptor-associated 31-like protein n=1 Tax=Epithele typhae TaxID=378194 RepID=UPI002008D091|nr:B-cell receptor-associated 31-like protein [Epithele typhae]KAH9911484.1 B-cell receptor-associated 31-like protein [Epithele typhae]
MTVYYTLTFMLLASEMGAFCVLVFPLPHVVRKKIFNFLSESPLIAKVAYGVKISFIFVAILFVDAVQRMWRVTAEADLAKSTGSGTNIAARKFYAQRNVYLTGFCLFLSLVLTRTFSMVLDLIHTQEEYAKLKQSLNGVDQAKEIKDLKARLTVAEERRKAMVHVVKKQAEQNAQEYDRLAEEYNRVTGSKSDKRRD